ncbi:MAG: hypothetical protein LUG24_07325 [Clostridiales bacterium]|nr:hypothetical protein [Clostridiales bacterium]
MRFKGHGECNVHLLRYFQKNSEDTGNSWSGELGTLLTKANNKCKEKLKHNEWFDFEEVKNFETNYGKIILKGYRQNKKTKNTYAKSNEITLLNRLKKIQIESFTVHKKKALVCLSEREYNNFKRTRCFIIEPLLG